jgi:hypothetical protein
MRRFLPYLSYLRGRRTVLVVALICGAISGLVFGLFGVYYWPVLLAPSPGDLFRKFIVTGRLARRFGMGRSGFGRIWALYPRAGMDGFFADGLDDWEHARKPPSKFSLICAGSSFLFFRARLYSGYAFI